MNPEKIETIKAFFGTIGFLFVILPIILILIPFKILISPNHVNLFELGTIRYFGILPIAIGTITYFLCSYAFVFSGKGTPIHQRFWEQFKICDTIIIGRSTHLYLVSALSLTFSSNPLVCKQPINPIFTRS